MSNKLVLNDCSNSSDTNVAILESNIPELFFDTYIYRTFFATLLLFYFLFVASGICIFNTAAAVSSFEAAFSGPVV